MATKFKFKIGGKCVVTQLDNGSYSHQGSTAWDIASKETDKYLPYYCNVPLICKAVNKTYCFTWWQSTEKVEFADGTEDYIVLMLGHDETINAYVGMKIGANVQIGNMGAGGNATGVHVHVEFGKGQYKGTWYANSDGVYVLYNAVDFVKATYMDDLDFQTPTNSEVKNRWSEVKAQFKYTTDEESEEVAEEVEETTEEVTEDTATSDEEVASEEVEDTTETTSEDTATVEETEDTSINISAVIEKAETVKDKLESLESEEDDMTISELLEQLKTAIEELESKAEKVDDIQAQVDELNEKINQIKDIVGA